MNKLWSLFNILFQKLFIKKRYLLVSNKDNYKRKNQILPPGFIMFVFNKLEDIKNAGARQSINSFFSERYNKGKIRSIINKPHWYCFAILEKQNLSFAGLGWLICNHNGVIWYDNIPTNIEESRLADHFVLKKYRGNKLGMHLGYACYEYAMNNNYNSVIAHVESYNKVSINNQKKFARIAGVNYLIKFFGLNLFSILVRDGIKKIWYVGPGSQKKFKDN